jgi:flagellar biosynthesis/type III secretory pathway protein FliH
MTLAQQFHQEGYKEGYELGYQEGLWMGRIQALEKFMGRIPVPLPELEKLSLTELQERFQALEHEYHLRHKA